MFDLEMKNVEPSVAKSNSNPKLKIFLLVYPIFLFIAGIPFITFTHPYAPNIYPGVCAILALFVGLRFSFVLPFTMMLHFFSIGACFLFMLLEVFQMHSAGFFSKSIAIALGAILAHFIPFVLVARNFETLTKLMKEKK